MLLLLILLVSPAFAAVERAVNFSGDDVRWYPEEKVTANGNVKVTYQDYTVNADTVEADLQTNIAVFKGSVTLSTKNGEKVNGANLKINLKTREWMVENADSKLDPAVFQGQIKGTTYIHGLELIGDGQNVKVESGSLTTCDREHPHYSFKARDIEIYPGIRIVAHNVSIYGLDRRLFTLAVMVIPLKNMTHNLLPQVGSSVDEGAFIKTALPYMATGSQQGFLKLDVMQKKGIGSGLDHTYKLGTGEGQISLYFLRDKQLGGDNLTGRIQHHQKFGLLDLNFTSNYNQNSYSYYPTSTTRDWQLALNYGKGKATTAFNFQSSTTGGIGTYTNSTASFRHMRQFSNTLSSVLSVDLRSSDTSGSSLNTRGLETSFELRQRGKQFDLSLTANKQTDLSHSPYGSVFGGLERLPEITLDTDTYRLFKKAPLDLNSRICLIAGEYNEMPLGTHKGRMLLQWDMLDRPINIGDRNTLNINAGVRQAYYASDMAQYVLKTGALLTSNFTDDMKARISYSYQRPEGFSPFQFDYTGKYDYMRAVIDYQHQKQLKWSLSTGYDMYALGAHWQDMALQVSAHPSTKFGYGLGAGYNLNTSKWQTILCQLQLNLPQHLSLDMGNKYDSLAHSLQTRGRINWQVNKLWRIEGISSWNGDLQRFDYRAFRITRDLHCLEASLTYTDETGFTANRGISFDIRIKALPFLDRFGFNQYGQQVDTSLGQYLY